MISLLGLDPATYRPHPLHDGERTYQETNCFADAVIELVAAAGHEPEAMLAGAAAVDFEVDQWTFFKPAPEDLLGLYGLDLHEMQPYRSLAEQTATRLAAGQTVMPEVDSFYLPDVAGTAYRTEPRQELARRRGDRPRRPGAALLPQRRLLRAVRRRLRRAVRLAGDAALRRAGPPRRRAGALRAGAARRGSRAARRLPGPPAVGQPVPAVPGRPRGGPAPAARGRRGRLPRLRLPQPPDGRRLVRAAREPRALAARRATARRPRSRSTTSSAAPRCCCSGSPAVAPSTSPA